jgi:putative spermidine/putrescine transport system substrate-binding protein
LPAVSTGAAKAARAITIAGYGGWFETNFDPIVLGAFRKAHPGIGVFYYPVGNSFQMLALLRGQRALPSIDVVLMEAAVASRATFESLLEPLTPNAMPVIKDLIPQAILPAVAGPALMLDSLVLGYSPSQVAIAPRTWRNLWDIAYGRRIALQTPPDPLGLAMTSVAATLYGGGDLLRSLDVGMTALSQLAPRVVLWDPVPDIYTAIALGDAGIGPGWNARAQNQAAQTPGRFAANIPEEGSPVMVTTVNLVKGSLQADAARTLIAWLLGSDAQRLLTEAMFFAPVNARMDIPAASLARVGATPAMAARRMEMDWVTVTSIRDQITAEWRRRMLGSR